jgi:ZIP family zinc transporter
MNLTLITLSLVAFSSTLIGGIFAIKFRKMLPYFFAFASGTMIAVTFFDIIPESLEIASSVNMPVKYVMIVIVSAFLLYHFLEKYFLTHHFHDGEEEGHGHIMGQVGAGTLILHSFLDGVAIGTAYQANYAMGLIVALAVIFHDFTDGINTVTLMFKHQHGVNRATVFLVMDALAPVLGIGITFLFIISQQVLVLILAAFAGEFLYIATETLLPEVHKHTAWKMNLVMILGIVLIFALTSIIR